jgi:Zn-dependent protease
VHADELTRIRAEATALEEAGELKLARDSWLKALELLPPEARQAEWVRKHAESLKVGTQTGSSDVKTHEWARKFGPLAPIAIALAKGKALLAIFKFKFLLSFAAFLWFYAILYGGYFGIGFAALILMHEMGHFIDVRRRGLSADMPIFLPGFGAYVKWKALGVPAETRAFVSLAAPLAGWIASAVCALIWWKTGAGIWAALARASVWLNVLNLIPIWILDGGQAIAAMNKAERISLVTIGGLVAAAQRGNLFLSRWGSLLPSVHSRFPAAAEPPGNGILPGSSCAACVRDVDAACGAIWGREIAVHSELLFAPDRRCK